MRSSPHSAPSRMSAARSATSAASVGRAWPLQKPLAQLGEPARADAAGDGLAARLVVEIAGQQRGQVDEAGRRRRRPRPCPSPAMRARRASAPSWRQGVSSASAGRKPPVGPPTSTALSVPFERRRRRRASRAATCPAAPRRCPGLRTAPLSWTSVVPGASGVADRGEGARAVGHDPGHGGERLDVVDDGRARPHRPALGRIRRSLVGLGAPVLERAQQRRSPRPPRTSPPSSRTSTRSGRAGAARASAPR